MIASSDLHREIISFTLNNPRILKYLRDHEIPKAQVLQHINTQFSTELTNFRYDNRILRDVRKFQNRSIPFAIFNGMLIKEVHAMKSPFQFVMDELQTEFYRSKMYWVAGGIFYEWNNRLFEVVYGKIGKKHNYIAVYEVDPQQFMDSDGEMTFLFSLVMSLD